MSITLVVPGLLALPPASLQSCTPLATLARLASVEVVPDGIEVATLRALDIDVPVAPLVAAGAGLSFRHDAWLCADPVVLVAGHDDVRLVGRVDDLTVEESAVLQAMLNEHFAGDGVAFEVPRPDRWLVRIRERAAIPDTTPLARAQRTALRALLPSGDDAAVWRRWLNEIQMLLHDAPVNVAREARGRSAVSGLWFWGGGRAPAITELPPIAATAGREGDLVRGLACLAGSPALPLPPRFPAAAASPGVAVLAAPADERALSALAGDWLSPAIAAVEHGRVERLVVVADAGGPAAMWRVDRPSSIARLRARWSRLSFEIPPGIAAADRD